jgi:hypothetical protein
MAKTKTASETIESKNKAFVLEAFDVLYHSLLDWQEFNRLGPQQPLFFVLTCSFLLKHPFANVR